MSLLRPALSASCAAFPEPQLACISCNVQREIMLCGGGYRDPVLKPQPVKPGQSMFLPCWMEAEKEVTLQMGLQMSV